LRDGTPPEPFVFGRKGYGYYNSLVENAPKGWKMKYYEKISDEPTFETRSDADGEFKYILPNWRLKEDAATARKYYLDNICPSISGFEGGDDETIANRNEC
jgi:hypothetical protein